MPGDEELFVRKPLRKYPVPDVITDLDSPNRGPDEKRYERVNPFQEGYDKETDRGLNPNIVKPAVSKSDLLSKM
jgi:hypothetical protein